MFPRTTWLQAELEFLMGIFDRFGINSKLDKTVGMVFQPCSIVSRQSDTANTCWMIGVGPYFWEQQQEIVWFSYCEVYLATGLLAAHYQFQKRKETHPQWMAPLITLYPRLYSIFFPRSARSIKCLVGDCEGQAKILTNL